MLAVQFASLAVLHPWLMRSWATAIAVLASGWVMLSIAALFSAWAALDVLPVSIFLTIWIIDFALLARIRSPRWQLALTALVSAYTIGGPILWYFGLEFGPGSSSLKGIELGPLFVALSTPGHVPPQAWIEALALGLLATALGKLVSKIPKITLSCFQWGDIEHHEH